jgi:hypothetical protein
MALTWQSWSSVSEGSSTPGASVAAVPWKDSFALFISDPNGGIYAIIATPGYGWESVPGLTSKPGSPITALLSGNLVTLFMANVTGEIFTTSGAPYQGWQPWTSVSEGSSTPGASVAAVPWEGSFALFISDPNGGIYAIKATPGYGWEPVPGLTSMPGAPITALLSGNLFTLFMADVTGEVFTTSGAPYQGWQPWTSVSEGSTAPGAPVAAIPWAPEGLLEPGIFALFISDPNGGIYAIKATPGYGWELVPGLTNKPGGQIAVVPWYRPPIASGSGVSGFVQPQFLLFMVDVNGEVSFTSGRPYQSWDQWTSVPAVSSVPGAPVTALPEPYGRNSDPFSIFVADSGGGIRETTTTGPPATPILSVAGVTSQTIDVSWTESNLASVELDGFELSLTSTQSNETQTKVSLQGPAVRALSWTGLNGGVQYTINITAFNANGYSPVSTVVATTPPALPAAPTGIHVTVAAQEATSSLVSLGWTDNSNNETGFRISFTAIAGSGITLAPIDVPADAVTYSFVVADNGTTYSVNVQAFNAAGASAASEAATFTLPPPSVVTAASITAGVNPLALTSGGTEWDLDINGSNFQDGEIVQLVITWWASNDGDPGVYTKDTLAQFGGFAYAFPGVNGPPYDADQRFQIQATGLTSHKMAMTSI